MGYNRGSCTRPVVAAAGTGTPRAGAIAAKIAKVRERREVDAAMPEQRKAGGESQISPIDPDARMMVTHSKTSVGYNAQVAVDAKHKLIVEQHVANAGSDMGLLAPTAGAAKEAPGVERIDALADMGYYKGEDIEDMRGERYHAPRRSPAPWQRHRQRPLSQGAVPLR